MPTLILDLFKITLPHHPGGRRHLGINYLVPSTAGDRERINLASLRRQHVASMQSRLPTPPPSSSRDAHAHALGLETWDDGTVELRGFPIEDILVVRMVNKMTGETDTSYELHFEYVFDAERVADVLGLAAGPPVEKDEGPGGWRGDRDGGFREVEKRSMIPIPVQPPREGERRSMIPVPVQPPHPEPPRLKVRKSQRF
ncbi:hypothetical protein B0H65DRAFT_424346 [Neurospora tetraspora]|uniref:Uncharacterized protein n=1 Tax=Neurospora tetraspora TaxID=94610 RepID=A0AAE0JIH5_9PEZI|nr:hypothetical protein B0H65DRAFT_424346 [Neurospora tetraspora]